MEQDSSEEIEMSCIGFKGQGTKKRLIQDVFLAIFILLEILIFVSAKNVLMFDFTFVIGQTVMIIAFLIIYFISLLVLKKEGELDNEAYIVEICENKIKVKSPFRNITILGEDVEAIKIRFGTIYFRFKDFSKYAKAYNLSDYQVQIMQKKGYYWVGNSLPVMSKEEKKKFERAITEFKGRFDVE